jgi:hypothetical protein
VSASEPARVLCQSQMIACYLESSSLDFGTIYADILQIGACDGTDLDTDNHKSGTTPINVGSGPRHGAVTMSSSSCSMLGAVPDNAAYIPRVTYVLCKTDERTRGCSAP